MPGATEAQVDHRPMDGVALPGIKPTNGSATQSGAASHDTSKSIASLLRTVSEAVGNVRLIVVSNRESIIHEEKDSNIVVLRPASGLVTAVEPIVMAMRGTWVAHGSGSADRAVVDPCDRVGVPLGRPSYQLRRVWLTEDEELGYYDGLSNEALWPLCHIAYTRPTFRAADWQQYRTVNEKFAEAVLEESGPDPAIVFIHDYHLALLPRLLKERRPDLTVVHFWHIPWPNREAFRILPWGEVILDGLLGADLLGFQTQLHCNNFLDTVDRGLEARVDYEQYCVHRGGHASLVRPFPISIDYHGIERDAQGPAVTKRGIELMTEFTPSHAQQFIVSVDRIDYTKGIPERLAAFDQLLVAHPELRGQVTYLNFCAPSRTRLTDYRELNERIDKLVADINERHGTDSWAPVQFVRRNHDYTSVLAAYRLADVLVVSSLHDGMNLVVKEFVAARTDGAGTAVLSSYAGAARELDGALLINPYDTDQVADRLYEALRMPLEDQKQRMTRMRKLVADHDVYHWGTDIFAEIGRLLSGTAA